VGAEIAHAYRAEFVDAFACACREHVFDLSERGSCGFVQACDSGVGREPQSERNRDRLVRIEQERRNGRARPEPVAAAMTANASIG
jgi:hypothetical protein